MHGTAEERKKSNFLPIVSDQTKPSAFRYVSSASAAASTLRLGCATVRRGALLASGPKIGQQGAWQPAAESADRPTSAKPPLDAQRACFQGSPAVSGARDSCARKGGADLAQADYCYYNHCCSTRPNGDSIIFASNQGASRAKGHALGRLLAGNQRLASNKAPF